MKKVKLRIYPLVRFRTDIMLKVTVEPTVVPAPKEICPLMLGEKILEPLGKVIDTASPLFITSGRTTENLRVVFWLTVMEAV